MIFKNIICTLLFTLLVSNLCGQTEWMKTKDGKSHCEMAQSGKFIAMTSPTDSYPNYFITYENGIAKESINDGENYIISEITFISACTYQLKVIENSIPNHPMHPGLIITNKILSTSKKDNFIELLVSYENISMQVVLKKIKK